MKKMLISILLILALAGCGKTETNETPEAPTGRQTSAAATTPETPSETPAATQSKTPDEIFQEYKDELVAYATDTLELNNSSVEAVLADIESVIGEVEGLTADNYVASDDYSRFILGMAYFGGYFDPGTKGHVMSEYGFEAAKCLFLRTEGFADNMAQTRALLEDITGRKTYSNTYNSGQYKVGTDIPAGEYVIFANSGAGYFCLSSDSNGNDIITNNNFKYNSIISVLDGEYLALSRSYAVPIDEVQTLPLDEADMLKVGMHIESGEYKLTADGGKGYYCVYNDGRQDDIEANKNFESSAYVTVKDGQYLLLSRCSFSQ